MLGIERATKVAGAFVHDPREAFERTLDQLADRREQRGEAPHYAADAHWDDTLREVVGPAQGGVTDEFDEVWHGVETAFAELHLPFGRGSFGGWDDGDPALARAVWHVVRQLRPTVVIETGVGRGVVTRVILDALERNSEGHLWSIDVPPLLEPELADETGAVVPPSKAPRWTFVRGSSRRRLRGLLSEVGSVDVFVHDSFHSARNLLFEWETAFGCLRRPGALLADDVHRNAALDVFTHAHPALDAIVCRHSDGAGLFAVLIAGKEARS
jgi:methyltransferase family protein